MNGRFVLVKVFCYVWKVGEFFFMVFMFGSFVVLVVVIVYLCLFVVVFKILFICGYL